MHHLTALGTLITLRTVHNQSCSSGSNVFLYYIELAYQRSRLCHKCDITTGCICKPGFKCDVSLHLNRCIAMVDLDRFGLSNDVHEGLLHEASPVVPLLYTLCILPGIFIGSFALHAMYTGRHLQWFLCYVCSNLL